MRGISGWNYRPYTLLNAPEERRELFVCRIAPQTAGFTFDYVDTRAGEHKVCYRLRGAAQWEEAPCACGSGCLQGLEDQQDYEFYVLRTADGTASAVRLVRTGAVPGVIVNYLHPEDDVYAVSGHYLCSPGIVVLPDGRLMASMDVFGRKTAQNLTLLFESLDGGNTWRYVTELYPCFWGKLFVHGQRLYMLGMACEYGDLLLGYSEDGGYTWSKPVRLFNGSNAQEIGPHKAPMPLICAHGRLYTAIDYGAWKYGIHDNALLSIDLRDDLMESTHWHLSQPLAFDAGWKGLPQGKMSGCIEGNAVEGPDGKVYNMLRLQQHMAEPSVGKAVLLEADTADPDAPLRFAAVVDFPLGASSKFVVLRAKEGYVAVGNEAYDSAKPQARNVLSVAVSPDLHHWKVMTRVVDARDQDSRYVAFQYPDMAIQGDDLLILSRTAWNGAQSYHDNNFITCYRITNYPAAMRETLASMNAAANTRDGGIGK